MKKKNLDEIFSRNLKAILEKRGIKRTKIAEITNNTAPTITNKLGGVTEWKINEIEAIASFLEIPIETLLKDNCHE